MIDRQAIQGTHTGSSCQPLDTTRNTQDTSQHNQHGAEAGQTSEDHNIEDEVHLTDPEAHLGPLTDQEAEAGVGGENLGLQNLEEAEDHAAQNEDQPQQPMMK